jgi:hypothetical protein
VKHKDRMLARSWFVSGRLFDTTCTRCGCRIVEMADKCPAKLDDPCPGFAAVEAAMGEFEKNFDYIKDGAP